MGMHKRKKLSKLVNQYSRGYLITFILTSSLQFHLQELWLS